MIFVPQEINTVSSTMKLRHSFRSMQRTPERGSHRSVGNQGQIFGQMLSRRV